MIRAQISSPTTKKALFWSSAACLTVLGVFVLPLQFPPQTLTASSSYVVGFNNHVASLAVILLSLAALAGCLRLDRSSGSPKKQPAKQPEERMPLRWLILASLAMLLFVAISGGLALHTDSFTADAAYFLSQLAHWSHGHAKLYQDVEFAYGPLLFLWPAAFEMAGRTLGLGPECAYVLSLAAMQVLGIAMAFGVIQRLPLSRAGKGIALAIMTLGAMRPALGLNYTLLRYTAPLLALLWIPQQVGRFRQALLLAAAQIATLAISPEIGFAFALGVVAYAIYKAITAEPAWLLVTLGPVAGLVTFCLMIDPGYFYAMRHFANGMLNLVVGPAPEILTLLIAAIALAPLAVARYIRLHSGGAGGMVGFYIASLALMPSALGLCDGLHTFFNGIGLYLLSLCAATQLTTSWRRVWTVALLFTATSTQIPGVIATLQRSTTSQPNLSANRRTADQLEQATDGFRIFAPAGLPLPLAQMLREDDRLVPDFYDGLSNAFDPPAETRKLAEMRDATFVLLPETNDAPVLLPDDRRRARALRLGYSYPLRHAPFLPLGRLRADVLAHAVLVPIDGSQPGFRLYRLSRDAPP